MLSNIISVICIGIIIIFGIAYKIVRKKHLNDPEFMRIQKEKERAYREKETHDREDMEKELYGEYEESVPEDTEKELDFEE